MRTTIRDWAMSVIRDWEDEERATADKARAAADEARANAIVEKAIADAEASGFATKRRWSD